MNSHPEYPEVKSARHKRSHRIVVLSRTLVSTWAAVRCSEVLQDAVCCPCRLLSYPIHLCLISPNVQSSLYSMKEKPRLAGGDGSDRLSSVLEQRMNFRAALCSEAQRALKPPLPSPESP